MTTLFIDADACPVKTEAERVATRHGLQMYLVSNGGLRPSPNPLITVIFVPEGPDAADIWIAERAHEGDVVITSDIPLAAKCLGHGARVLRPDGSRLTPQNIGHQLAVRDLAADLRAADPFRKGGGRPFTKRDRSHFLSALENTIAAARKDVAG